MNKLWVFGDSMSCNHNKWILDDPNKFVWPEIVAESLNLELINKATIAIGNDTIIKTLSNNLWKIEPSDTVIIGLTNPIRYKVQIEGQNQNMPFYLQSNHPNKKLKEILFNFHNNIIVRAHDELLKDYYTQVINIQKVLTKQKTQSLIWSWYAQVLDDTLENYAYKGEFNMYDRLEDGHFSYLGHEQFANNILSVLEKNIGLLTSFTNKDDSGLFVWKDLKPLI